MPLIVSEDNIKLAYRHLKTNKGSKTAGIDKETIKHVKKFGVEEFIDRVKTKFRDYKTMQVRRVYIPKKNGKIRPLGIPTFTERLCQQCIKQILEPIFESKFFKHSYGFRPGRSQHDALARCGFLINMSNCRQVIEVDIKSYFDNIDFTVLSRILWSNGIHDKELLTIIRKILQAPIYNEGIPEKGICQGSVLSPLLSNIYLNEFDQWFASQYEANKTLSKTLRYKSNLKAGFLVRFADDLRIFTKTKSQARRWYHAIDQWFQQRLRLTCSREKTRIINLKKNPTHFLGIELKAIRKPGKKRRVCRSHIGRQELKKINNRYKAELKTLLKVHPTGFSHKLSMIESVIRGIRNYYRAATMVYSDLSKVENRKWRLKQKLRKKHPCLKRKKDENTNLQQEKFRNISLTRGIKYKKLLCHSQKIFYNTISKINIWQTQLNELRNKTRHVSIELSDNILSLFTQQRGKDPVTGYLLDIDRLECHHKIPKFNKGTDCFRNLILLDKYTHKAVHGSLETLQNFCNVFRLSKRRLKKLFDLRKSSQT